MNNYAIMYIA